MAENKVKLSVLGFSFNQTQSSTYGLVLAEDGGVRRLMIVVGTPEAQSIAFKLQNTTPPRPLTHDLFYTFMSEWDIQLEEVLIYKYENGIFHSQLKFKQGEKEITIESRTSDAIGIGLRSKSPIFTTEEIMQSMAVIFNENDEELSSDSMMPMDETNTETLDDYSSLSDEEIEEMLHNAIENEDYELASELRDELTKRTKE